MANSIQPVNLDMTKDLAPSLIINLNITGIDKFIIRVRIARLFFWLGAKIMNCGIRFSDEGIPFR